METGRGERFKTRMDGLTRLSTHTVALIKALEVVEDERQGFSELVAVTEKDQSISAREVCMASSPFYGLIHRLKAFLGLCYEDIKNLVITVNVFRNLAP